MNIKLKSLLVAIIVSLSTICANAQEVSLNKGDVAFLKGEKTINIICTFNKMSVGEFNQEAEYIKKKTVEYNTKEAGTGDTWAKKWEDDKVNMFLKYFIKGYCDASGMTFAADAKYTIIFNTSALEPGYQIGFAKKSATVDGVATIVETANQSKVLASLGIEHPRESSYRGAAFDVGTRIAQAYLASGKKLWLFIKKGK